MIFGSSEKIGGSDVVCLGVTVYHMRDSLVSRCADSISTRVCGRSMEDESVAMPQRKNRPEYTLGYYACAIAKDLGYESPYCFTQESPSAPADIGASIGAVVVCREGIC